MSTDEARAPRSAGRSRLAALSSVALVTLAVGGIGVLLHVGRAAFVPVAFSLLFALILSTPVEALHRRGLPRSVGAVLILLVLVALATLTLTAVWGPAREWIASVPRAVEIIERRAGPIARAMEHSVVGTNPNPKLLRDSGRSSAEDFALSASGSLLDATPAAAANVITIVFLTLFLLAGGAPMAARLTATLSSAGQSVEALRVIGVVRSEVAHYYATLALINVGLGVATALVTTLLGLPNPLLWGTMACVFNFIPYVGSATTLVVLTIVAFVTFESVGRALAVIACFLLLVTIEGQLVEPLLIGRRLRLGPIAVFLALWFGGWFWGVAGMFLAIPVLVTLKVVAEQNRNGRVIVELLSPTFRPHFKLARSPRDPAVPSASAGSER